MPCLGGGGGGGGGHAGGVALGVVHDLKTADATILHLKTSATSRTNGEWEKAGDSRASRGEGKVLRVRIYTPPTFKVVKVSAFPGKKGGGGNCPLCPPLATPLLSFRHLPAALPCTVIHFPFHNWPNCLGLRTPTQICAELKPVVHYSYELDKFVWKKHVKV